MNDFLACYRLKPSRHFLPLPPMSTFVWTPLSYGVRLWLKNLPICLVFPRNLSTELFIVWKKWVAQMWLGEKIYFQKILLITWCHKSLTADTYRLLIKFIVFRQTKSQSQKQASTIWSCACKHDFRVEMCTFCR